MAERYTREQLTEAFELVQNPKDWKARINKTIEADDNTLDRIGEAVIYFTGTVPDFERRPDGRYRVTAIGYRNGPCGP